MASAGITIPHHIFQKSNADFFTNVQVRKKENNKIGKMTIHLSQVWDICIGDYCQMRKNSNASDSGHL